MSMDDLRRARTEKKVSTLILNVFRTSSDEDGQDTGAKAGIEKQYKHMKIIYFKLIYL